MENHLCMTGLQELFSHTNPSNFWRSLQLLVFRHTTENLLVP